jgi:hypothetical protein
MPGYLNMMMQLKIIIELKNINNFFQRLKFRQSKMILKLLKEDKSLKILSSKVIYFLLEIC